MLSLFSIPKAFSGLAGIHQSNAIGSWVRLKPECEIILFGDDPGVAKAAARFGVRHESALARTPQGTPILSDAFARANAIARHDLLCYVNADIILFDDFTAAALSVVRKHCEFLTIASRYNLRIDGPLPFDLHWDRELRARALAGGRMYPSGGSDIFMYPRDFFGFIPPFAVGRGYWDNWLMSWARQRGASLIDATDAVVTVHQDHDYAHVVSVGPGGEARVLASAEGVTNLLLAGGRRNLYTAYEATEILSRDGRLCTTLLPNLIGRRLKGWLRRHIPTGLARAFRQVKQLNH